MRELSVAEQRYQAVLAVGDGETVKDVAARFGVSRQTVHPWLTKYESGRIAPAAHGEARERLEAGSGVVGDTPIPGTSPGTQNRRPGGVPPETASLTGEELTLRSASTVGAATLADANVLRFSGLCCTVG